MIPTTTDSMRAAQLSTDLQIALRQHDQWVLWRGVDRIDQTTGEVTGLNKVPYTVHLSKASTTHPQTWASFDQCVQALPTALEEWEAEDPEAYQRGGLGFVFTANDPYVGVDLDHCRDPETGEINPWAQHLINALASYTEVSPSGTGVHLFVHGHLAEKGRKRGDIELYDRERYFTVTGAHHPGKPTTVEDRQAVVEWLYVAMPILAKLLADSGKREKFERLLTGDTSEYGNDDSRADLALCSLAAHTGASAEQMDALMRLSGLYRAKWDEMRSDQTYGQMTIAKALEGQENRSGASLTLSVGNVVCLATVQPVAVDWLWKPYLPLGKLCSLEGDPGTGKSTLTATLAAYVTTGRLFPGEADTNREPRNVLFLQCEDDLADTFLPRLVAADADVSRVYAFPGLVRLDDTGVEQSIAKHQPALVVIDPIQGYIGAKTNINQSNEVRPIMERLRSLAETYRCTVLCVRHFGKNQEQKAIHHDLASY